MIYVPAEVGRSIRNVMGKMIRQIKFKPKVGQTDFTDIRWAPVINCVLKYKKKYLVIQRSMDLNFYPGYWNGVSGFLDDKRSLEEKVYDEIREELGITQEQILSIKFGDIFDQDESKYQKTWIVHPVLVTVNTDKVVLDWESKNYLWLSMNEIKKLDLLPGFDQVLKRVEEIVN